MAAGRRPWLAPLMRELRAELDALLTDLFAGSRRFYGPRREGGVSDGVIDREQLDLLVAVVDGAVVNALIEASPDPRAAARRMLLRSL